MPRAQRDAGGIQASSAKGPSSIDDGEEALPFTPSPGRSGIPDRQRRSIRATVAGRNCLSLEGGQLGIKDVLKVYLQRVERDPSGLPAFSRSLRRGAHPNRNSS